MASISRSIALSAAPHTTWPDLDISQVGREHDLEWLRSTEGDLLLVGEPGSGKTFLLRRLASKRDSLFLVSLNRTEIAGSVRELQPRRILVDDCTPGDPVEAVRTLLQVREQLREEWVDEPETAPFSVLVACGRDLETEMQAVLGQQAQTRRLEWMTRSEIMAVIEEIGADWPLEVKGFLVDQSGNKPGLAVTLARLLKAGDVESVRTGHALWSRWKLLLKKVPDADLVLAALSLSGPAGMTVLELDRCLQWEPPRAGRALREVGPLGVLKVSAKRYAVDPPELRSALIKDVFFGEPPLLEFRTLLDQVEDRDLALQEIIRAAGAGAEIASEELRDLVTGTDETKVWREIADLEEHARWALEKAPRPLDILAEVLRHEPEAAVRWLLDHTDKDEKNPLSLKILSAWLDETAPYDHEEAAKRREHALRCALRRGEDSPVAMRVAILALSPQTSRTVPHPAKMQAVSHTEWLPAESLKKLGKWWKKLYEVLHGQGVDASTWSRLQEMLGPWVWASPAEDAEIRDEAKKTALTMLRDLETLAGDKPGMAAGLRGFFRELGSDMEIEIDPAFELLYLSDTEPFEEEPGQEKHRAEKVREWAAHWARRPASEVVGFLAAYEEQASWADVQRTSRIEDLSGEIAALVNDPEVWLEAVTGKGGPAPLATALLERLGKDRPEGWEQGLERSLADERVAGRAAWVVLGLADPPEGLLKAALETAPEITAQVADRCWRGEVPMPTLKKLLESPCDELAVRVAIAEWEARPRGRFREEPAAACRQAILRSADQVARGEQSHPHLGRILVADPDLGMLWIQRLLRNDDARPYLEAEPWRVESKTLEALSKEQKTDLLGEMDSRPDLVRRLVGHDVDLYEALLDEKDLSPYHLHPLRGRPHESWPELARLALDRGFEPKRIAQEVFLGFHSMNGFGREYWHRWRDDFAKLEEHPDEELQEVIRFALQQIDHELEKADEKSRRFEMTGSLGSPA